MAEANFKLGPHLTHMYDGAEISLDTDHDSNTTDLFGWGVHRQQGILYATMCADDIACLQNMQLRLRQNRHLCMD